MTIVIDVIDECEEEDLAVEIISLIADACADSFPFTFLFTSRPEPKIRAAFANPNAIRTTHPLTSRPSTHRMIFVPFCTIASSNIRLTPYGYLYF